ncbi:hypothetical protein [Pseudomonas sp. LRF_L74]|uniref:hypothetical protein n=1 Tax=Pseudomonas sp. LRF_L74 TaxID=3369422 RepID=UPI003F602055
MRRVLLIGLCLLLGACAARAPLPSQPPTLALPLSLHIQREQDAVRQDWLLVVQEEHGALRWSLFDPLGMPLSRQLLKDGAWHNDGLLPPNGEARELFAVLLFALTPADQLAPRYDGKSWAQDADDRRRLNPGWRIVYRAPSDFTLDTPAGPHYRVTPLDSQEGF